MIRQVVIFLISTYELNFDIIYKYRYLKLIISTMKKYINASDDEKSGNSVGQLKSIIEHQKDSLRKFWSKLKQVEKV